MFGQLWIMMTVMGLFKIKEILNTMDEQQLMWFCQNRNKLFMGEN